MNSSIRTRDSREFYIWTNFHWDTFLRGLDMCLDSRYCIIHVLYTAENVLLCTPCCPAGLGPEDQYHFTFHFSPSETTSNLHVGLWFNLHCIYRLPFDAFTLLPYLKVWNKTCLYESHTQWLKSGIQLGTNVQGVLVASQAEKYYNTCVLTQYCVRSMNMADLIVCHDSLGSECSSSLPVLQSLALQFSSPKVLRHYSHRMRMDILKGKRV